MKLGIIFATFFVTCGALKGYCDQNKPKIEVLLSPKPDYEIEIGETLSLVCAGHSHGSADPYVYWTKGHGADGKLRGKNLGPVAIGKSTLFFEAIEADDIDTYRCVIESCCASKKIEISVEIRVPDMSCKNQYGLGNVIYWANWEYLSWNASVAACQAKGLQLAFPTTPEENAQLLEDVQASFKSHPNARKYAHENWLWLGAHDLEEEGKWIQANSNKEVEWFNWQSGQPDDWKGTGGGNLEGQDCIGMSRDTGRWDDSFKFYKRPYACKCNKNVNKVLKKKKKNGI